MIAADEARLDTRIVTAGRALVASFMGNTWTALVQVAFVPVYLAFLGPEAFGLIGVYAVLQAALAVLDVGLAPTLGRESARAYAGAQSVDVVRQVLRSAEWVVAAIGLAFALAVAAASEWVASHWLRIGNLPPASAAHALQLMGLLVALRLFVGLHRGVISGHQRLGWLNAATAGFATLRAGGVVAVLAWWSPTIEAFFAFQCAATALEAAAFAARGWSLLPSAAPARFSPEALRRISTFSGGIALIGVLYLVLAQADKVLLSAMLPLGAFGYYTLAASIAAALNLLAAPIGAVAFPRFNELAGRGDGEGIGEALHLFARLTTLAVAPAAVVLALFAEPVLRGWTGDPEATAAAAPLLRLLALGAMFNAFMGPAYMVPLARGSTRPLVLVNLGLVATCVPAIYMAVGAWGAIGAAAAYLSIHAVGMALAVPLMRGHLPAAVRWRWLLGDAVLPAGLAGMAAGAVWSLFPGAEAGSFTVLGSVAGAYAAAVLAAGAWLVPGLRSKSRTIRQ